MGAEDFRHQIKLKTTAALLKKFEAGHVVNGKLYGFDNVEILRANGERSHVVYRPNAQEAAVLRRIFVRYAAGAGFRKIAAELNADGVPAPKRRRAQEWAASTLRDIVRNESYLGRFTYQGRTLTWPERQLIDDSLWGQVQRRAKEAAAQYLKNARGQLLSKPPSGHESKYLLSGLLRRHGIRARVPPE